MEIRNLEAVIKEHPFFAGLPDRYVHLLVGCASNVKFDAGELICRAGDPAAQFYIVRSGQVAVELHPPEKEPMTIQTLGDGDVLGWSWLIPPYRWTFDSRAITLTRALVLDATCLRGKCEEDHDLGFEMMKRFSAIVVDRLNAARLQLVDLYASPTKGSK